MPLGYNMFTYFSAARYLHSNHYNNSFGLANNIFNNTYRIESNDHKNKMKFNFLSQNQNQKNFFKHRTIFK